MTATILTRSQQSQLDTLADLARGDHDAVVRRHERMCWRVANRFRCRPGLSSADLDDIAQECRMAVHRSCAGYDPAVGVTFLTYAMGNAVRAALAYVDRIRRNGFHGLNERPTPLTLTAAPLDGHAARPDRRPVRWSAAEWDGVLAGLTPLQRAVVQLRVQTGLTQREIGRVFGVSKTRIDQHWRAAVATLRELRPDLAAELEG